MDEERRDPARDEAEAVYQHIIARYGLSHVTCPPCARALLPAPFNWESYTYRSTSGQSWTWDVPFARAVVTRRLSRAEAPEVDRARLATLLQQHGQVYTYHIDHIPAARLHEPLLVAPLPTGRGHVLIDGAHRATLRMASGLLVRGVTLTAVESDLAREVVPLAIGRIYRALRSRHLLPPLEDA
jgi:hypothetical protein